MAVFQEAPSIGPSLAEKIVNDLEIYDLNTMKNKKGGELFDQLEKQLGVWTDPCVEDQIRCLIYYANNPQSRKRWFDFTQERKAYRIKYGYPDSRPAKAWYEINES
ncbi:Pathogenicity locus [Salinibacillus kushneri]|uniref:Pathogenicity locus n=1 Tax=Salinibacillus kushneri TaxID=237682 RepID=A0A1I0EMT6_9BACI|nr:helix-hairpin-helix domain-containing protein [Salinibacillus kushneri]SET46518.1 Pathogenicity locus [Salinibacillus kushneri]